MPCKALPVRRRAGANRYRFPDYHRAMRRLFALLLLVLCEPLRAGDTACEGIPVSVDAAGTSDHALICQGARQALVFLAGVGLDTSAHLSVLTTDAEAIDHHPAEIGSYDARDRRVRVRTYEGCARLTSDGPLFRIQMEGALYASFIAHEIAHAVIHANAGRHRPARVAQEYIAYVVQLASMPEALRARILARYDEDAFGRASEIGETYLLIDPHAFAVKVYRHYLQPENGAAFLRRLIDGTATLGANGR